MNKPTASEVRAWTPRTNWGQEGYPAGRDPDSLDFETKLADQYVEWVIERPLDASMPPELELLAQKAVALRVAQQVTTDSAEQQEAQFAGDVLKGFSVTGYSEQYVDVGEASQAQRKGMMINPWPELNRLLWALCTPKRLAWWRGFLSEGGIPAYGVVEMDWSGANRFGGYAEIAGGGLPGDYMLGGGLGDALGGLGVGAWPTGSNTGVIIPEGFGG